MKRFRLTKAAKILIMVVVVALLGGGVFVGLKTGLVTTGDKTANGDKTTHNGNSNTVVDYDANGNVMTTTKTDDATINLKTLNDSFYSFQLFYILRLFFLFFLFFILFRI